MTVYTATKEMCHTSLNYGEDLLPFDWPGKKFRLRDDVRRVALLENEGGSPTRSWTISPSLSQIIQESVITEATPEEKPDTVPLETHEATIKDLNTTISDLRNTVTELRNTILRQTENHERFKGQVVEVAMEYGERHDWCDTVKEALEEMGLEVPQKEHSFTLPVVGRVTGTQEAYGKPDVFDIRSNMNLNPEDIYLSLEGWSDGFDIEVADYDVMDVEEQE